MVGSTRCRMHGGKPVTRGIANLNVKHGKFSKYMPKRLLAQYDQARQDSD